MFFKCSELKALEVLKTLLAQWSIQNGNNFEKMKKYPVTVLRVKYLSTPTKGWKSIRIVYPEAAFPYRKDFCTTMKKLIKMIDDKELASCLTTRIVEAMTKNESRQP